MFPLTPNPARTSTTSNSTTTSVTMTKPPKP